MKLRGKTETVQKKDPWSEVRFAQEQPKTTSKLWTYIDARQRRWKGQKTTQWPPQRSDMPCVSLEQKYIYILSVQSQPSADFSLLPPAACILFVVLRCVFSIHCLFHFVAVFAFLRTIIESQIAGRHFPSKGLMKEKYIGVSESDST